MSLSDEDLRRMVRPDLHRQHVTMRGEPRRTATCADPDLHRPIASGGDVALFNGLLAQISDRGTVDPTFLPHVNGLEEALQSARHEDCAASGLSDVRIKAFCDLWIGTEWVVTVISQGVNQSTSGADKVNAILICHLASGRIGQPRCGPFSVIGQTDAMGGREVGGLSNMLACHLDLENPNHRAAVRDFWQVPAVPEPPGLKAVDMFRAVGDGRNKAFWIVHANPAVSIPDAAAVRQAIADCPFVVVTDITARTDTARLADVNLPATAWSEKNGTVTNSVRTISRQRAVLPPPKDVKPDWEIMAEVGRRMGYGAAMDYDSPAGTFGEYAALFGIAGTFGRDFHISGLSELSDAAHNAFEPVRWPVSAHRTGGRFFADGQVFHADGRARMVPVKAKAPAALLTTEAPFRFNTGRLRDQWHIMTRTALSSRLSCHLPEPFVDIHPDDARRVGVKAAEFVVVKNDHGQAILRARITADVQRGDLFAPIDWTGETAPSARVDDLVAPHVDPASGQPASKASTVAAHKFEAGWYGFAVATSQMHLRWD
ncbi:molybdopterin oxidoreductase family protein [Yoonia sp. 208BN28-4]|uniref:molybdopterin oxidoreductase family protein n=1 Tax=Yoonia sp. 208BN28-4 TaxID=3126505 RepID=UPI00309D67E1